MEGSGGVPHDKGWALDTVDMDYYYLTSTPTLENTKRKITIKTSNFGVFLLSAV